MASKRDQARERVRPRVELFVAWLAKKTGRTPDRIPADVRERLAELAQDCFMDGEEHAHLRPTDPAPPARTGRTSEGFPAPVLTHPPPVGLGSSPPDFLEPISDAPPSGTFSPRAPAPRTPGARPSGSSRTILPPPLPRATREVVHDRGRDRRKR